jgi:hypothetical protein
MLPKQRSKLKKFILATLAALVTAAVSVANARDDEPSPEVTKEFASNYMRQFPQQWSDREIAKQLTRTIILLEKVQLICPSYYYVNARRARFDFAPRYLGHDVRTRKDQHVNNERGERQ